MAKQVTFNDDTNERDKELVGKIKLFSKEKKISFTEAIRQLCEFSLTAKKNQKIIESRRNKMKKTIALILCAIMLLSLCACGKAETENSV